MTLIAGGDSDPVVQSFLEAVYQQEMPHLAVLSGNRGVPKLTWDIPTNRLVINGSEIKATALWLRVDVFTQMKDQNSQSGVRANVWYDTLSGWALANEQVRYLNRDYRGMNKLVSLRSAIEVGLKIPETLITNQFRLLDHLDTENYIAKPVIGGAYTQTLTDYLENATVVHGVADFPVTIQPKLVQPEMRIFGIGETFIAFWVESTHLDYRTQQDTILRLTEPPPHLVEGLQRLMKRLGLDFTAADFKTDAQTGELLFLEVNSSPMFAAFDAVSDFAVSKAILKWLLPE